jgi:3-deoxy-D-manno-octulosonate 8-phosphate phosphatase (KDO 8-P phosphatase)
LLKSAVYKLAIISSGICSSLINRRGKFLNFDKVTVTNENKVIALQNILDDMNLQYENVLYIGDDINDYEAMSKCKIRCCPADASEKINDVSQIILSACGGNGCLREVAELMTRSAS